MLQPESSDTFFVFDGAARLVGNFDGRRESEVISREWILSFSPNLERLVLRCIDSYDSESRLILKHFSRTTRSTILCTAQISKFQEKVARFFRKNESFIFIFIFIPAKFDEFYHFSAEF